MSEKICVAFPKKGSEYSRAEQDLNLFNDNFHVRPFTVNEDYELLGHLYELSLQKKGKIAHFVFRGSLTGLSLEDSLPESVRRFYQQIHFGMDDDLKEAAKYPQYKEHLKNPANRVVIDNNGGIDQSEYQNLVVALKNRSAIILGGGPGHPRDRFYRSFNLALEREVVMGATLIGICLGHQMIFNILGEVSKSYGSKKVSEVAGGYNEIGSQMEQVTEEGKNHPVFGRFGDMVNVVHVNEYHVSGARDKVLTTNALGEPSAYELQLGGIARAITWQAHPEFPMVGLGRQYQIGANGEFIQTTILEGTSIDYGGLSRWLATGAKLEELSKKYDVMPEDIANLVDKRRLGKHLGVDFYGPALLYLVSQSKLY